MVDISLPTKEEELAALADLTAERDAACLGEAAARTEAEMYRQEAAGLREEVVVVHFRVLPTSLLHREQMLP